MGQKPCPRQAENPMAMEPFKFLNKPEDGTCDYCGSLDGDAFMARVEAGDVELSPTDKNYKVYVKNVGGAAFKQSYRIDQPSKPGEVMKDPADQTHWLWETREMDEAKFYFQHLSEEQKKRFIELLNEKKLKIGYPGHFYRLPFFMVVLDKPKEETK